MRVDVVYRLVTVPSATVKAGERARRRRRPHPGIFRGALAAWDEAIPQIGHYLEAFQQGLRELGDTEGRNVVIEYRWPEGRQRRLLDLAAKLVRLKVDVIVVTLVVPILSGRDLWPASRDRGNHHGPWSGITPIRATDQR